MDPASASSGGETKICGCVLSALEENVSLAVYEKYTKAGSVPQGVLSQDALDAMSACTDSNSRSINTVSEVRLCLSGNGGSFALLAGVLTLERGNTHGDEEAHARGG